MSHNLTEKITLTENQLKATVEEYNQLTERKNILYNQILQLQGALGALKEVDHEHTDQPTDTEST